MPVESVGHRRGSRLRSVSQSVSEPRFAESCLAKFGPGIGASTLRKLSIYDNYSHTMCCGSELYLMSKKSSSSSSSCCRTPNKRMLPTSRGSTDLRLRASMTTGVSPSATTATTSTATAGAPRNVETPETPPILSKQQARDLAVRLTPEERDVLISALQETQSQKVKAEYEGQLAAFRWRSKFGRPSRVPSLGDVDPTGTYCAVPEDWLLRKYAETVPQPTRKDLIRVSITNAIPFIGFGFLDNFFMIIAGDQIETSLGAFISLSTMAAAAFGNTISDILGIGSAFYVERLVQKIGFKAPKLTPIQMDMPKSRRAANLGRVLGVTIGCLLGMSPLLILHKGGKDKEAKTSIAGKEPVVAVA
ncbi:transmembrane protein 65 isoform X1 [Neodiprion fabricii]|uniref:transmembrane protein 65 isoform X1 n=2 Tax=Neodiprion fabricii TaxID=2872261 RepID=UPI001ED95945|nr:transmembrane protein 65 isoform X1 [Neodiprion fabricii]